LKDQPFWPPQTPEDLDKDTKDGNGFSVPAKLQVAQSLPEVSLFSPTFKHSQISFEKRHQQTI